MDDDEQCEVTTIQPTIDETRLNSDEERMPFLDVPYIKNLNYRLKTHGAYDGGKPKGIVIHYTVSPTKNKSPEQQAAGILSWFEKKGYGTLVLSTDGQFYKAYNHKLEDKAWHTGPSYWASMGERNVHHYALGIEVCNAGLVGRRRNGYHPAWHYKDWDVASGELKSNVKAQSFALRDSMYPYPQKPGLYEAFTAEQEHSLIDFCVWACLEYGIDHNNIVGHDEIDTRGCKSDPGGSLSMPMRDFRMLIQKLVAVKTKELNRKK